MPNLGWAQHCQCGYAIYVVSSGLITFYGNEQDEMGGVEIRNCPNCLRPLAFYELFGGPEFKGDEVEDAPFPQPHDASRANSTGVPVCSSATPSYYDDTTHDRGCQ